MKKSTLAVAGLLLAAMALAPRAEAVLRPLDESKLVTLPGNTVPEALNRADDRGVLPDTFTLPHLLLQLKRPQFREQAFNSYIEGLTNSASPNYHRWLTADEVGTRFGLDQSDIAAVVRWLSGHGFVVERLYPSRLAIEFSGTVSQVRAAFHTEVHRLSVRGTPHIANTSDPKIPASLAPVVEGIVSLNDIRPRSAAHGGPGYTIANCGLGSADLIANCYFVTPPDLATIYDFKSLFAAGTTGMGETVAVAEDSDIYSSSDWTRFRSLFGLSGYSGGTISQVHPGCSDPGTNGDDFEATLDVEYASAAAPDAAIVVASCADSATTSGVLLAVENLVNEASPPPVLSVSYIWCEAHAGAANDKAYFHAYQQAVAEGTSVFVSAGDEGAATCDYGKPEASRGIAANGIASTPFDVAVGGTDFEDTYFKKNATYWSASNSASYGSAKSYVPEIPWNGTCASRLVAKYVTGSSITYGNSGFCNQRAGSTLVSTWAGSGGPSSCARRASAGGCIGYPKPKWQQIFGNPNDSLRDLPDVALFSAGAPWGHAFIVCLSDPAHDDGVPCSEFPNSYVYGYGTSFASPIMAGIQALVDQATGTKQGNPNPTFYRLARAEFGTTGNSACDASRGNQIGVNCIFHDVTQGDIDVPCAPGTPDCYAPSGSHGALSLSQTSYKPAFSAIKGWDFATGLGSVDVANLVKAWPRP